MVLENSFSCASSERATDDTSPKPCVRSSHDAARLLEHIKDAEQEHFFVLGLDAKHCVVVTHCAAIGTADRVVVHPRDVFRELVRHNCVAFVAAHNHPSGDPHPSPRDLVLTHNLMRAGGLLGIELLDHIIMATDAVCSIREEVCRTDD